MWEHKAIRNELNKKLNKEMLEGIDERVIKFVNGVDFVSKELNLRQEFDKFIKENNLNQSDSLELFRREFGKIKGREVRFSKMIREMNKLVEMLDRKTKKTGNKYDEGRRDIADNARDAFAHLISRYSLMLRKINELYKEINTPQN